MKRTIAMMMFVLFATMLLGQTTVGQQTKDEIKPSDLPKCVSEWVVKNLPGYVIDKAFKFTTKYPDKTVITYLVRTKKDKMYQWLTSDALCKEIKKVSNTAAEPAVKTKPPTN